MSFCSINESERERVSVIFRFVTRFRRASRWATRVHVNLSTGFAGDDEGRGEHRVFFHVNQKRAQWKSTTNPCQHFTQRSAGHPHRMCRMCLLMLATYLHPLSRSATRANLNIFVGCAGDDWGKEQNSVFFMTALPLNRCTVTQLNKVRPQRHSPSSSPPS